MKNPIVTVLMSAYNTEEFVAEAVESVLQQSFREFELLIFDDKSTDSSLNILQSFKDPRIRLVKNDENLGLTRNLIQGMHMARGEFVARMDADDICLPHRLAVQVSYMKKHSDISVLGSAVTFFDESGWEFIAHQPTEHDDIKCTLFFGFTMLHPSVMIRKSDFEKHGLNYDPAFRFSQDHDLWTRAIHKLRFANIYEPLLRMREHGGKIGKTQKPQQQVLSDSIRGRQLEELQLKCTPKELEVFSADESSTMKWCIADLQLMKPFF